jgi:hypothetical protein
MTGENRKRRRSNAARERRVFVRGIRREEPDLPKLARALLALAQREADAARAHTIGDSNVEASADPEEASNA